MSFDDRKKRFESEFSYQQKNSFDVEAKTSKLYGLWAAEQLGLEGDVAETYAMSVVEANLEEPGFDDVLRKVRKDFDDKGLSITNETMSIELERVFGKVKTAMATEKEQK